LSIPAKTKIPGLKIPSLLYLYQEMVKITIEMPFNFQSENGI